VGSFVPRAWQLDPTALGPRRARAGGTYQAYVPDRLGDRPLRLDARIAADVSDAERAMAALDAATDRDHGPHRLEVLARLLLRAEAVGSSRIEGLVISPRKLALADLDPALDRSGRALEVVGNLNALRDALELATRPGPVTVDTLCAIHARLLADTRDAHLGGLVRTEQNWIGGHSPLDAEFVPPPHELLPELLDDLCAYLSGDAHPPLVQAALAHAQFETLHPFADGNGRTGRALLQLVLRRRGLCRRFVPPISLVLATWSKRYVAALMGTRVAAPAGSEQDVAGLETWIELTAQAVRLACAEAQAYEGRVDALVEAWRAQVATRVGSPRADSALWVLIDLLPAAPLLTTRSAVELTGRSERAIDGAIRQLLEAGVLKQVGGRVRYRLFEARGVFDLVTDTERALASPERDTQAHPPVRPVPARPERQRG
jgi:Fic family protein